VNNGDSCFFWKDKWSTQALDEQFPHAYSFAKNKHISVKNAFSEGEFTELFALPLSQVAFDQVLSIQHRIENIVINEGINDVWTYSGGASKFKSTVAYRKLLGHQEIDPAIKWLLKSSCQPKHKYFFWLLLKDRLSTRNILRRKHMALETCNYEICSMLVEEIVDHLFWRSICSAVLGSLKSEYN
jgi:hypothetical protein